MLAIIFYLPFLNQVIVLGGDSKDKLRTLKAMKVQSDFSLCYIHLQVIVGLIFLLIEEAVRKASITSGRHLFMR